MWVAEVTTGGKVPPLVACLEVTAHSDSSGAMDSTTQLKDIVAPRKVGASNSINATLHVRKSMLMLKFS